jgi:hypothetical protein
MLIHPISKELFIMGQHSPLESTQTLLQEKINNLLSDRALVCLYQHTL